MNKAKKILSLLLAAIMLCGLVMVGSAATQAAGIYEVYPSEFKEGDIQIVGQKTIVSYDTLASDPTIEVRYRIFMDETSYYTMSSTALKLTFDPTYLKLSSRSVGVYADEGYGPEEGAGIKVDFDYIDSGDRSMGAYIILSNACDSPTESLLIDDTKGNGYAVELTFYFKAEAAFKNMNPANGTKVKLEIRTDDSGGYDFYTWNPDVGRPNGDRIPYENALEEIDAIVTYSAAILTYTTGDGSQDDMTPFNPKVALSGEAITIADGSGLTIPAKGDTPAQAFDYWTDGTTNYNSNQVINMPNDGLELTAVYADDTDGDGIPDKNENKLTYKLRAGDEGVLTAPASTSNGNFLTDGSDKYIFVAKDKKIDDAIATVDLTGTDPAEKWVFVGYFIGDEKYTAAELADMTLSAATVVEVRTMPDSNENGIDDRDNVTLNFYADDAEPGDDPVKSYSVPDGTPYTVYSDPDKATTAEDDTADTDPTDVDLPTVPDRIDNSKLSGWEFEVTYETPGDNTTPITGVVAYPVYTDDQIVKIPDVVDKDTDDVGEVQVPMEVGSIVIHRDIDEEPIKQTVITSEDEIQNIVNPTPGSRPSLPKRDADNNPFKGWDLTGPIDVDGDKVYYLDPVYEAPIDLSIVDVNDEADPLDDEFVDGYEEKKVPSDSEYEIKDGDGNTTETGDIPSDGIVDLPADEDMPVRNDDGDIFTGDWGVEEKISDSDGHPIYVITPEYRDPTNEDIEIIVDDADSDGDGLTILSGAYADDTVATATYFIRVASQPAIAADAARFSAKGIASYGFEALVRPEAIIGNMSNVSYVGTKLIDGVTYGEFTVDYTTIKSGIVKLVLAYKNLTPETDANGHIVVTVADATKDGTVNSSDVADTVRVINGKLTTPAKGKSGAFVYELMDTNEDAYINSADVTIMARMINRKITTN